MTIQIRFQMKSDSKSIKLHELTKVAPFQLQLSQIVSVLPRKIVRSYTSFVVMQKARPF